LLAEGLMRLVPYHYLAWFGVRSFSELICAYHAGYLYVYPKVKLIRGGGGNSSLERKGADGKSGGKV
jgi:hypothetical protein